MLYVVTHHFYPADVLDVKVPHWRTEIADFRGGFAYEWVFGRLFISDGKGFQVLAGSWQMFIDVVWIQGNVDPTCWVSCFFFKMLQDEMTEKELELESKTQRGVKALWLLPFCLTPWQRRLLSIFGRQDKHANIRKASVDDSWCIMSMSHNVPAMTSLLVSSNTCWIMLIGGTPKQIAFGMNIGSWCDLAASCVQNLSFHNCMRGIFVPVTCKYFSDSLSSMLKIKLKPFHKQTSLSDPLVSCEKEWCLPVSSKQVQPKQGSKYVRFVSPWRLSLPYWATSFFEVPCPVCFVYSEKNTSRKKEGFFSLQRCFTSRRLC